ncbi:MAG: HAD family hydrolase [Bacilli bacterium]
MITTIFFDIGDVILLTSPALSDVEAALYDDQSLWFACKTGQVSQGDYLRHAADRLGVNLDTLVQLKRDSDSGIRRNDSLVDWIRSNRQRRHLQVIAVSNADMELEERLERYDVDDLFDHVVNSARVGMAKPDPAIYRHALALTSSSPDACLFVDDRERNIATATALGMHGHVYTTMEHFIEEMNSLFSGPAS